MSTALLVIDVQQSFLARPVWRAVSRPDIAHRVGTLVQRAREAGDEVIWVLHSEPGTGDVFDPAGGHVRLMDGLVALEGEPVLTKTSRNAFTTTALAQLCTRRGIDRLVIAGIQTEQCCETTARVAADLGYQVDFVTEATATFPVPHRDAPPGRDLDAVLADPLTLGVDAVEERTEYALAGRFARIVPLEEALLEHPLPH